MKRISFSLFIIFALMQLHAQDLNFQPLKSSGKLPETLFTSSTTKYKSDLKDIKDNEEGLSKNEQKSFYLETNFRIDALLQSGKVLFNDPIGLYINDVVDEILKDDPELRKQLHFYAVKSPFPNAFTTNDGIILVNVGLMNRLDTEAQLAFILCHEIAHFKAKHIIKGYALSVRLKGGKRGDAHLSDIDKLILKNNYSQENERMADSIGFELFRETSYSTETLPAVFDILKVAHEPHLFPSNPFSAVENPYWQPDFSPPPPPAKKEERLEEVEDEMEELRKESTDDLTDKKKRKKEIDEFKEEELQEETFSTHPSPNERKELIIRQLIAANHPGEASFLVSVPTFLNCKQMAAYEVCRMFLLEGAYFDALYEAVSLLESSPDDPYLNEVVIKSLYGIAKYRNNLASVPSFIDYENLPNTPRNFHYHLASNRHGARFYVMLALAKTRDFIERFPETPYIQKYLEDLTVDLLEHIPDFEVSVDTLSDTRKAQVLALQEMLKDSLFQAVYDRAKKERKRIADFAAYKDSKEGKKKIEKFEKARQNRGYRLGLDHVVVFSPFYYQLDSRKESPINFIKTEAQQDRLPDFIQKSAKKLKLEVDVLDGKTIEAGMTAEAFNDMMVTSEWYGEFTSTSDFRMIPSTYGEMMQLTQKYGTRYFVNMGSVAVRISQDYQLWKAIERLYFVVTWPWAAYTLTQKASASMTYAIVFDVEENRAIAYQYHEMKEMAEEARLEAFLYYYLWQIKKG